MTVIKPFFLVILLKEKNHPNGPRFSHDGEMADVLVTMGPGSSCRAVFPRKNGSISRNNRVIGEITWFYSVIM